MQTVECVRANFPINSGGFVVETSYHGVSPNGVCGFVETCRGASHYDVENSWILCEFFTNSRNFNGLAADVVIHIASFPSTIVEILTV